MDVAQTVLDAARNNDWEAVRLQLHPFLHWYDASGEVRGRNSVLMLPNEAMLPPHQRRTSSATDRSTAGGTPDSPPLSLVLPPA
jgi:hypothetical protein